MDANVHEVSEAVPLFVGVDADDAASSEPSKPQSPSMGNHRKDIHILSAAFLFVFSAYCAAQNLESTVNTEGDLGTTSLGILYLSFTLFSIVASPVVRMLGSKNALVVGTSGYFLFIVANFKPTWYTMLPASVYLGFTASIIWVGQGTYLTSAALSEAKNKGLNEREALGRFNGEFWGAFAANQVVGNLIALSLLRDGKEGGNLAGIDILFTVFLCCMIAGIVLMCFLSQRNEKIGELPVYGSFKTLWWSILSPLSDRRMLLLIPLIAYSGLQQAFVWSEYTKLVVSPVLGISGVGGAMAIYGAADVVCSFFAGRMTSGMLSITVIVSAGAFVQAIVLIWLLLCGSLTNGITGSVVIFLVGALWGIGDGVLNTQLSALLGMLFQDDKEAAFAQMKVWQSASIAVVFFISPYVTLQMMLILMGVVLTIALCAFLCLTRLVDKAVAAAQ